MLEYDIENTINTIKENNFRGITNNVRLIVDEDYGNLKHKLESEANNNINQCKSSSLCRPSVARKRWKILAKAIKGNGNEASDDGHFNSEDSLVSVRRFRSFDLIEQKHLGAEDKENLLGAAENWYSYKLILEELEYSVNIHHLTRPLTATDLMGFNNTGNVCIWPSEEALAFYCLSNIENFKEKTILELGGGMTCLAGLLVAKYANPHMVHLTDGNCYSVENVKRTCRLNEFSDCYVKCSMLKWENVSAIKSTTDEIDEKFDCILSADCLFFDDVRSALVDTMWRYLTDSGISLVMAPRRGTTLDEFIECAVRKGFNYKIFQNYNEQIWQRHLELEKLNFYDENIHYPILIKLTKSMKL